MAGAKTTKTTDIKEAAQTYLVSQLEAKTLSSGKTGFYAQGKVTVDGVRYQSQIMLVKIEKKD